MSEKGNTQLHKEIRKGVIEARYHGSAAGSTIAEILFISIFLGIYYASWWLFGGALLIFSALMFFRVTRLILFILFTIGWIFIAWLIGHIIGSLGASVVLSCLSLIIAGGLHLKAYLEWKED